MGVWLALPFNESAGVDNCVDVEGVSPPLIAAAFFAAFSARRFCLDADGAMDGRMSGQSRAIDAR